jgi:hypothetical protein
MRVSTSRLATLALIVVVAAATGCASKSPTSAVPGPATSTIAPAKPASTTATPPAAKPSAPAGKVKTLAAGSPLRIRIFKAAMDQLGMTGSVMVPQLFVQGDAAVGDLKPPTGQRVFFAMTGGPDSWRLVWSAPFGSAKANAAALTAVDPGTFTDLARSLDFKLVVNTVTTDSGPGPTLKCFQAYARKSAKDLAGTTYIGTFTIQAKIAKDSSGTWWGNAIAEPSEAGLESIGVWGRWNGNEWIGEIADFSTEDADAGYFPASVLGQLAL